MFALNIHFCLTPQILHCHWIQFRIVTQKMGNWKTAGPAIRIDCNLTIDRPIKLPLDYHKSDNGGSD